MKIKNVFNTYNVFFLSVFFSLIFYILLVPYPTPGWTQETMATPYTGKLSDGKSSYNFLVPQNWNGTVLVSLDTLGYWGEPKDITIKGWLLDHGYALAGTDRESVGWNLSYAAANVVETLDTFIKLVGEPRRAVVWGESRGGITTRAAIQLYPNRFDGAVPMCGGGAGSIAMYNFKLDAAFALDVLLGSEYGLRLELNNIQDLATEESRIKEIISKAQETPQGRARVALAGAFSQIPVWNQKGKPEPANDDYDAQQANVALGIPMALGTWYAHFLENLAGGPFTWNHGVDYREQLNNSGYKKMVQELYNKAGLDLKADLDRLAKAPRVCADPAAVSFIEKNDITWNGKLQQPVLSLTTTGDMSGPISDENSYADVVRHAEKSDLLRQAFVHRCDHCNFTAGEEIAVFVTLFKRLDTGKWEDDASAQSLNQLVKKLQSESSLDLGGSNFVQIETPKALRTWDVRNWDTYKKDGMCQ
jgi:pimeloyl-ACP methyl ester carboxylesterase